LLSQRWVNAFLDPVRERRAHYEAQPGLIEEILASGIRRMRRESDETMRLVREAMGMPGHSLRPAPGDSVLPPGLIYC